MKCSQEFCNYSRQNDFQDPIVPALAIPRATGDLKPSTGDNTGEQATKAIYDAMQFRENQGNGTTTLGPDWAAGNGELDISDPSVDIPRLSDADLPHCPQCKDGLLRPGVVWFGEPLPEDTIEFVDKWSKESKVDLVIVVGTSAKVFPAASYIDVGRDNGARVAVVNMDPGHLPRGGLKDGDWFFQGDASVILPEILKGVIGEI